MHWGSVTLEVEFDALSWRLMRVLLRSFFFLAHKQWKAIKCIMKGVDQFDKHF